MAEDSTQALEPATPTDFQDQRKDAAMADTGGVHGGGVVQTKPENAADGEKPKNRKEASPAKPEKGGVKAKPKAKGAVRVAPPSQQYHVRATVVRKELRVGDQQLSKLVEKQWKQVHHSLYYITVFAPMSMQGKVVKAANKGIRSYVTEKVGDATRMLKEAGDLAEDNGIAIGAPGFIHEHVVEVSSQVETDVLELVRALDDYVVMMDSLWIGRYISDDERNGAHKEARDTVTTLHRLALRMRMRLIDYRHKKMKNMTHKPEDEMVREMEGLVLTLTGISIKEPVEDAGKLSVPEPRRPNERGSAAASTAVPAAKAVAEAV